MANERKTERIVRSHFEKYTDIIHIEEQISDNPKIEKLLKLASKKGTGKGFPEFIITFKKYSELIIVIECKADIRKHESQNRDKYSEFAVDGALLYASYLSKEYDVIAIAVSGTKESNLSISHFLHLKELKTSTPIFSNSLLSAESYLDKYQTSDEKFRQDYDTLIDYSKSLNDELESKKVKESQRSLLISGAMIALDNKVFKKSYKLHETPKDLADSLVETVCTELKNANIQQGKLENLRIAYSFIKTHASLSVEPDVLLNIIDGIENKIKKFVRTHKYYDVLSEFYVEFLRKSNSDKGLGIVLTPHHITKLFNVLAGTNKDSVVFDNCTGTSGFLISAMNEMIRDADNDRAYIKSIKEKQLVGIEYQDDIFALACSNMFIHQDGKTNIINGDCFKEENIKKAKSFHPNIGFLNPPYSTKKKKIEEWLFVINNLECLRQGGICVAIIPMSCVLAQKGVKLELKKKLLKHHTLEAVFSMPDELFFNSNVGVVTAIVVFTAHKPHPINKETYLGYWKDDGLVKRKTKGRSDVLKKWDDIQAKWISSYFNRKSIPGLSVTKVLTAKDEWCAEAYMETDYSTLTESDFIKSLKEYIFFNELFIK